MIILSPLKVSTVKLNHHYYSYDYLHIDISCYHLLILIYCMIVIIFCVDCCVLCTVNVIFGSCTELFPFRDK